MLLIFLLQLAHKNFKTSKRAPAFQAFEDEELSTARNLVAEEEVSVQLELAQAAGGTLPSTDDISALQDSIRAEYVYVPTTGQTLARSAATPQQICGSLENQFAALAAHHGKEKARLDRLQQRLVLLTKGYEERSSTLNRGIASIASERIDEQIKFACFVALAKGEGIALPARLASTEAILSEVMAQERELQSRYASSLREIDSLRLQLVAAGIAI